MSVSSTAISSIHINSYQHPNGNSLATDAIHSLRHIIQTIRNPLFTIDIVKNFTFMYFIMKNILNLTINIPHDSLKTKIYLVKLYFALYFVSNNANTPIALFNNYKYISTFFLHINDPL